MGSKKKKKKMALMTSLSRRETTVSVLEDGSCGGVNKSIGCMAGIFHFLSPHRLNNSRKRLPSAGRKKKIITSQPKEPPGPSQPEPRTSASSTLGKGEEQPLLQQLASSAHAIIPERTFCVKEIQRRHSCQVQRSPTLPSELRRSSSVELSLDSPRRPTPLVVRLMGLDEIPVSSPASAAEKRRKLLGALEKCDEDLKSLKRIIDAVRVADKRRKTVEAVVADSKREEEDGDESVETVKSVDSVVGEQQPSPVSVLEAVSSPTSCRSKNEKQKKSQISSIRLFTPEPSPMCTTGDLNKNNLNNKQNSPSIFNQTTNERLSPLFPKRSEITLLEEFGQAKRLTDGGGRRRQFESKRSHALVESVGEVWEDGVWEQRWEFGRVAAGLERGILRDLVDEFVREMLGWYFEGLVLQGSCRKRLYF